MNILRTILAILYVYLLVFMFRFNISPLIELYGGWYFLGINLACTFAGMCIGAAFGYTFSTNKPQATYKADPDLDINNPKPLS